MKPHELNSDLTTSRLLPKGFNKRKFTVTYAVTTNPYFQEIQNLSKTQCLANTNWPQIDTIRGWMVSAETATFMKWGGLGVIATELPEAFNARFGSQEENLTVVTPLYIGNTGKKKTELIDNKYIGAEHKEIELKNITSINVPFMSEKNTLTKYKVDVYTGHFGKCDYIFLSNDRFFNIDPHKDNPPAQDGCYIKNKYGINEVERFAFFSKAVYVLIKNICAEKISEIECPLDNLCKGH